MTVAGAVQRGRAHQPLKASLYVLACTPSKILLKERHLAQWWFKIISMVIMRILTMSASDFQQK